ncbi:MAG TPA: ATP-binding protein [Kofleriaceae bacterium]|nr:ATP-binding protein [Kofleriaceae bacterium]
MIQPEALVELFRAHSPAAMVVLDREMRYLLATRSWSLQYELDGDDLVGKSYYDLLPDIPPHWRAVHHRCLEGASERCERDLLVQRDGTAAWLRWEIWPWLTEDHAVGGIVIFSEVITQLKRLEDSQAEIARLLGERERSLELERVHGHRLETLRRSVLAISALEAAASSRRPGVLELILEQARTLTGADYGALGVGTDPARAFEPWAWSGLTEQQALAMGTRPRPVGLLGRIARAHEALRLDDIAGAPGAIGLPPNHPEVGPLLGTPIRHRTQSIGSIYLAKRPGGAPFTADDQAVLDMLAEHTSVALANVMLYRQAHADVETREEVLAIVSHDLKGPLNSIVLQEQLLAHQHGTLVDAHTATVARSVNQMRWMILGLLDVASLDMGNLRLDVGPVDFEALVREVTETTGPTATAHDVALAVHVTAPGTVKLDRDRMWQVLSNLLNNAVKFTPPGGRVEVRVERSATELTIVVADTGPGIAPDALPRVFDRYFTTSRGNQGNGLGLYIAKGIVEAHGGRIQVDSAGGQGATFRIAIPVTPGGEIGPVTA